MSQGSSEELKERPWEELERLIEAEDAARLDEVLDSLSAGETGRAVSRLSEEDRTRLLSLLPAEDAADLIVEIPEVHALEALDQLPRETAAAILNELPSNEQADYLGELEREDAEAILAVMDPQEAQDARALWDYEDDVAGGLMLTELLAYPQHYTVAQVVDDMREHAEQYRDYLVQYAYVVDEAGRLCGVLRLRDLLLAKRGQPIESLMIRQPLTVTDQTGLDELWDFFERHPFYGVPVIDGDGKLLGVVLNSAVQEAVGDRADDDFFKTQGLVREELRTMPVWVRSRRRLAWLSVNILLNVMAASVIAYYQETLASVIALAMFLPIISDMSGCSGNQAIAVSMRELSMGLVKPTEMLQVWLKEVSVGLINGLSLGLLIAVVAWLWNGNPFLGLVVGGALAVNTLVAVSLGGTLPLVLRRMNLDPALASGPILTTVTDMCGFFFVLSFASAVLPRLVTQ